MSAPLPNARGGGSAAAEPQGAFLVLDRAGRCTHASASATALLGRDTTTLVGRALCEALPGADALHGAVAEATATQQPAAAIDGGLAWRVLPSAQGAVLLVEPDAERGNAEPWHDGSGGGEVERARYLQAVLDVVPDCIKVVARDGTLRDINRAGLAMLDAPTREAVVGQPVERLAAPHERETLRRLLDATFRGAPGRAELEVITLGGRTRRMDVRFTPLRDATGAVTAALLVSDDVTDRHAAAERLRASEARFRQLAASAPVGMFLGAGGGRLVYVNPRFEAIVALPARDALGLGWTRRVHRDDIDMLLDDTRVALAAGRELTREVRIVLDDGSVRWIRGHMVPLRDEAGAVTGSIGTIEDVTEALEAAEAEARARSMAEVEHARLEAVLEALPAGVIFADANGRIVHASRQARALWGGDVTAESVADYGRYATRARGASRPLGDDERALTRALKGETTAPHELEILRLDGSVATVLAAAAPVRDTEGHIIGGVVSLTDVSERIRLEAQLQQAQKMEAVGQLAGGVAHDFNNLLTVIGGNLEFAREDLGPDHPVQGDLAQVAQAAERARSLVRQLLAFSRKQVVQAQDVDVNEVVRGADGLLRRLLGDEIVLGTTLADGPAVVRADRGQLEQVLFNLAVNARDAMLTSTHGHPGTGGTLTIGTDLVTLTAADAAHWAPLAPGRYVRLTVSDTGHGMDATTRTHMFEPFFTTKAVGAGTGLGLATVYGIVVQSLGAVHVDSAPNAGTTFTVLLPHRGGEAPAAEHDGTAAVPRGRGTVLVVEDEAAVRITTRRVLERHGYGVLEARHGADALLVWREHGEGVVCCVTDLRMPEMGGRELVAQLRADRPDLPVVYVSGYSDRVAHDEVGPRDEFVEKPFTAEALLAAVTMVVSRELGSDPN